MACPLVFHGLRERRESVPHFVGERFGVAISLRLVIYNRRGGGRARLKVRRAAVSVREWRGGRACRCRVALPADTRARFGERRHMRMNGRAVIAALWYAAPAGDVAALPVIVFRVSCIHKFLHFACHGSPLRFYLFGRADVSGRVGFLVALPLAVRTFCA